LCGAASDSERRPQYALKLNGSLGYANTAAGEGLAGEVMERLGFPALKKMGLKTIAMVYVTHDAAIRTMLSNPKPFINQLLAKAQAVGIDGFDIDYEPQALAEDQEAGDLLRAEFMGFLGQLAGVMQQHSLTLTIDVGASGMRLFSESTHWAGGFPGYAK
jgi:hypothetical protein